MRSDKDLELLKWATGCLGVMGSYLDRMQGDATRDSILDEVLEEGHPASTLGNGTLTKQEWECLNTALKARAEIYKQAEILKNQLQALEKYFDQAKSER